MLLFPSVYEGFGLPILEAMARGKPVIAADTPVFREVAGDAAWFVNPADPAAWAEAVLTLVRDPARAGRLREAGTVRVRELTYEKTAARTLEALREIAGPPSAG